MTLGMTDGHQCVVTRHRLSGEKTCKSMVAIKFARPYANAFSSPPLSSLIGRHEEDEKQEPRVENHLSESFCFRGRTKKM